MARWMSDEATPWYFLQLHAQDKEVPREGENTSIPIKNATISPNRSATISPNADQRLIWGLRAQPPPPPPPGHSVFRWLMRSPTHNYCILVTHAAAAVGE